MNRSSSGVRAPELQLQLNLPPPPPPPPPAATDEWMEVDGEQDDYSSDSSSPSSCVSSEDSPTSGGGGKSPMVIGACTRCLLYCMVSKKDYPTCINCKQPCLVDLMPDGGAGAGASDDKKRGKRK